MNNILFFKKISIFAFLIFSIFLNINILYAQNLNLGFIDSNIWYSKKTFSEGDQVKIYTLLANQENSIFAGKVNFYNNDILLGSKDFTLKAGASEVIDIDWKVTSGSNLIFAKIIDSKILLNDNEYKNILIEDNESEKSKKIIIKKIPDVKEITSNLKDDLIDKTEPISEIQENIIEKTPDVISKPIIYSISNLDNVRENLSSKIDNKKEEIQKEIDNFKDQKEEENQLSIDEEIDKLQNEGEKDIEKDPKEDVLNPFLYVKLFFLKLISFIFNTKIVFYLLILLIIFLIFRFIWNRFF